MPLQRLPVGLGAALGAVAAAAAAAAAAEHRVVEGVPPVGQVAQEPVLRRVRRPVVPLLPADGPDVRVEGAGPLPAEDDAARLAPEAARPGRGEVEGDGGAVGAADQAGDVALVQVVDLDLVDPEQLVPDLDLSGGSAGGALVRCAHWLLRTC